MSLPLSFSCWKEKPNTSKLWKKWRRKQVFWRKEKKSWSLRRRNRMNLRPQWPRSLRRGKHNNTGTCFHLSSTLSIQKKSTCVYVLFCFFYPIRRIMSLCATWDWSLTISRWRLAQSNMPTHLMHFRRRLKKMQGWVLHVVRAVPVSRLLSHFYYYFFWVIIGTLEMAHNKTDHSHEIPLAKRRSHDIMRFNQKFWFSSLVWLLRTVSQCRFDSNFQLVDLLCGCYLQNPLMLSFGVEMINLRWTRQLNSLNIHFL